eukprot:jgi/Bigna1/70875/fgenesh1_pg.13_\
MHDQLVSHVQQGISFVDLSIVKVCICTVVLPALRNATALAADEPRQVMDQGNSIGSQDVTTDHVEGAEGKEAKSGKSEVWTGGDGLREGIPVAQPVASERSCELGTDARHSLTMGVDAPMFAQV